MLLSRLITIHLNITKVCPKGPAGMELAYQPASRLLDMAVTLHTLLLVSLEPVPPGLGPGTCNHLLRL